MTTWPTVMVTSHRPQHLAPGVRPWVKAELERLTLNLRDRRGMTTGISGMALGGDTWFADAVVRAGLDLEAHVPYPQQADRWDPADQAEWMRLTGLAAKTVTYGTTPAIHWLFRRNEGMVDRQTGRHHRRVAAREAGRHLRGDPVRVEARAPTNLGGPVYAADVLAIPGHLAGHAASSTATSGTSNGGPVRRWEDDGVNFLAQAWDDIARGLWAGVDWLVHG